MRGFYFCSASLSQFGWLSRVFYVWFGVLLGVFVVCRPTKKEDNKQPWKLKPGFINRVLVEVIFEASNCL